MSRQIQFRRGSSAEHETFTGAPGEITVDTTNNTLRVHDGETPGGTTLAKQSEIPDLTPYDYVIEWQTPTADNNYTWYRKYKSGWVEQGGQLKLDELTSETRSISLPVQMANNQYWCGFSWIGREGNAGAYSGVVKSDSSTTTTLVIQAYLTGSHNMYWIVYGQSAE